MTTELKYSLYLVNDAGRRAATPIARAVSIADLRLYGNRAHKRFVILDEKDIQRYACDSRDSNGAYPPRGYRAK